MKTNFYTEAPKARVLLLSPCQQQNPPKNEKLKYNYLTNGYNNTYLKTKRETLIR